MGELEGFEQPATGYVYVTPRQAEDTRGRDSADINRIYVPTVQPVRRQLDPRKEKKKNTPMTSSALRSNGPNDSSNTERARLRFPNVNAAPRPRSPPLRPKQKSEIC